ncbi:uncharacterized protein ACJ7VT_014279 [Polymixia lowei]
MLVQLGKISKDEFVKARASRLTVAPNCSLVIKNISVEDVGLYTCRQFTSPTQYSDATVVLSLLNVTLSRLNDQLKLYCSVVTYESRQCIQTLRWLDQNGNKLIESNNNQKISEYLCSITVEHQIHQRNTERFTCQLTDRRRNTFNFTSLYSVPPGSVIYMTLVVRFTALILIIILVLVCYKRARGNRTPRNIHIDLTSVSDANQSGPTTSQDQADVHNDLTYASINHSIRNQTAGKAEVQHNGDHGDIDNAVTYATVRAPPTCTGDSADPSLLYAAVNKPKK